MPGKAGEYGIYVVGVNEEVFRDIWKNAVALEDEAIQQASSEKPLLQLLKPLPGEAQSSRTFPGAIRTGPRRPE